jgi:poly(A) polymerase
VIDGDHAGLLAESRPFADALPSAATDPFQVELVPEGIPEPRRFQVVFDEARIDPDVQKVVRRLVRHGHEAYLVGGCVRDLLVDRRPKDFDVATSARPEEVRELFRNSRIIGRRFRLVHVVFQGGKVIEVATFRRNPKNESGDTTELLIRSDNAFGAAHEDALRRDFRFNALFYDVEARMILDWVGGMDDVRRQVVHTIGDPETRFREDPIRILRALKFAGRLGFGITPDVYDAIVFCREALALAARPRLSEEILRLMRGGQARRTLYLAWETGVLDVLLPQLAALLYDDGEDGGAGQRVFRLLDYVDRRDVEDRPLDDTVLWTLLLLEPMKEACDGARDRARAVADFLEPLIERLAISRRYADGMRRIVAILPRLSSGRAGRFARTEIFQSALEVVAADLTARGEPTDSIDRFRSPPLPRRTRRQGPADAESL